MKYEILTNEDGTPYLFMNRAEISNVNINKNSNGMWFISFEHECELIVQPADSYCPTYKYGKKWSIKGCEWFCKGINLVVPSSYNKDADFHETGITLVFIPENEEEEIELDDIILLAYHQYSDTSTPYPVSTKILAVPLAATFYQVLI